MSAASEGSTATSAVSHWRGGALALVGILLVALSLRTAVAALSPILDHISHDIPLSALIISLLGAVPPIAFAVSGLLAPAMSRRLGLEHSLLLAIAVMVLGHLGRALAPSAGFLLAATVATLVGVGVANVLLPPIVKRYFPGHIGSVSAVYITIMSVGSSIPALIAVPVADTAGWRVSLAVWFVVALTAAVPWNAMLVRERRDRARALLADRMPADRMPNDRMPDDTVGAPVAADVALSARITRSAIAWAMVGTFGAAAFVSYATFAFLPSILVETAGLSPAGAGSLLALWALMGFPSGIVAPLLASRLKNATPVLVAGITLLVVGYGGLLLAPAAAPVLWTILSGLGPLLFPLTLALINLRTRTHTGAVTLSGFVQGAAYAIGAVGPIAVGLLHDATGGWSVPLLVMVVVGFALAMPAVFVLGRPRFLEDELDARAAARRA